MQDVLQLFTAQNGMLSAKVVFPDTTARHLHSLVDPGVESQYYERLDFWGDIIIFVGLGLGYHIAQAVNAIPKTASIIAIEYYDELIEQCKKTILSRLPNEVMVISASNSECAAASAARYIRQNPAAQLQTIKHPASFDIHKDFYKAILDQLLSSPVKASEQKPSHLRIKTVDTALLFYGSFFLEEEVRGALQANAIEPVLFAYNEYTSPMSYENALMRQVQEKRPSIVFSINMKGFDDNGMLQDILKRFDIPVIIWFVDDPRRIVHQNRTCAYQKSMAACWEKTYLPWLEQAGFSKVFYLPLATDPALFHAALSPSPSIPLGFVGTSMMDEYAGNIKKKFLWSESLMPLVEAASENLLANPSYDVDKGFQDCLKQSSVRLPFSDAKNISWLCAYIIHTASMQKRKRIVGGLLDEEIETFGDAAGWKRLLGSGVATHSDVDYRHCLRDIYRDICINVNVTSCQMPTAVNQRVFDVPCAGSFIISDNQKDLYDLFDVPNEAVVYANLDDLKEKIRFYLKHETERLKITAAAKKRILNEHTYTKRIGNLLRLLLS